jgi:hypothetical protein
MDWRPAVDDQNPWVRINFPRSQTVGRVMLYGADNWAGATVKTKAADGRWTVRGKLEKPVSGVITVNFAPVETGEIEIDLSRCAGRSAALSEVEVYRH